MPHADRRMSGAVVRDQHVLVAELLCHHLDVRPGERVIDVVAGTGNTALAAARRCAEVTATDPVPELLDVTCRRAEADGLTVRTAPADPRRLPFPDGSFDVVTSTFGAIFEADQRQVAGELLRVCRRGGRVGLTTWPPDGFVGELLRIVTGYLAPFGPAAQAGWGSEPGLRALLGRGAASLRVERGSVDFCYRSVEHLLEHLIEWYVPAKAVFGALGDGGRERMAGQVLAAAERYNRAGPDGFVATAAYLEVVAVRA